MRLISRRIDRFLHRNEYYLCYLAWLCVLVVCCVVW